MTITAACVDVTGSSRAMDVAYIEDKTVRLARLSNVESLYVWLTENEPQVLAIDAPSATNKNCIASNPGAYGIPKGKYENFRVCEAQLRLKGIGLYNTPRSDPPTWIERGWEIYKKVESQGYRLYREPGVVSFEPNEKYVFEVHPHASFVVGLGWIPQTKSSLAGQVERIAYLRKQAELFSLDMSETALSRELLSEFQSAFANWDKILTDGLDFPEISHDELDSIVGLFTAQSVLSKDAFATGIADDGVIVTPSSLAETTYCTKSRS